MKKRAACYRALWEYSQSILCYSAVYFLPILLFDVTVLFKAYRKNLQQHKQAEPLFHMKKKIWFENFLLRHLTLLKNIKGINKLFFEVLGMYISSFIQNDVTILEEKKILKLNSKLRISLNFCVYFFNTLFSTYPAHYYLQGIYNFV